MGIDAHDTLYVSALYYYPVKSCQGVSLDVATINVRGIKQDRELMLIDSRGHFLTQRALPRMALIGAHLESTWLMLHAPGMPTYSLEYRTQGRCERVEIWGERCAAVDQGDEAAGWFSDFLKYPCRLVCMPREFVRPVDSTYAHDAEDQVSFADGYPFLLLSEASLSDLNRRLAVPVEMRRFRPNIVISGCAPFAEDTWYHIRIAAVEFFLVKPCARCVITTIDPDQGVRELKEPLRTLAAYRRVAHRGVMFGQNLVHKNEGTIRVGDPVEILEYREAGWLQFQ